MTYFSNTDQDRKEMLESIGVRSFEELLRNIPPEARLKTGLRLPAALSEFEITKELKQLGEKNRDTGEWLTFLGGGAYDHYIPAAIAAITSRSEFYTAYTPYQAEVSQGTLQAIYEYQTMICRLTGMDVANASMYDGGSALSEAVLLALGHTGRSEVVMAGKIHPHYLKVVRTYTAARDAHIVLSNIVDGGAAPDSLAETVSANTACVVVQQPNFFGILEEVREIEKIAHKSGALFIVVADPISLGMLEAPGNYNADVVVGEGQGLGIALQFGGPYLGIFAVKESLLRKLPGRLSGITVDSAGRRGFTLTIQTREQHIRREKATSNICTNEGLMMLCATVYMALMGKEGICDVARQSVQKSHYLAEKIAAVKGYRMKFTRPFFKEFAVETPRPASEIVHTLSERGILAGIDLARFVDGETGLLIAVTEKRTREEMDRFVNELASF
ncbi:MAG: aminomethyl-transferring glycine dehydrogenase subunit GcvPA [Bacteroidota bacterium]